MPSRGLLIPGGSVSVTCQSQAPDVFFCVFCASPHGKITGERLGPCFGVLSQIPGYIS